MTERRPRVAVLVFPGSNDDRDAAWALSAIGADAQLVWHADPELPRVDAVVLPGGFSYGDYLRCGAIARFAPVMEAVADFAASGGPVLGICNGFQILCEAGLLPGVLRPNDVALVRLPRRPAGRRAHGHPLHRALRAGRDADDPGQARRGLLPPARRPPGGADRPALRARGEPERVGARHRRGSQRRRERHGAHAPSRACRGSPARVRRRWADPRLAGGRRARAVVHPRVLGRDASIFGCGEPYRGVRPNASANRGRASSSVRRRSRSRARRVTGPRRTLPPVEYANRTSAPPFSSSSNWTIVSKRRSPAR